ncbi:hypothetical protein GCG54_00008442 [Colletotrichum gloeosporioides]|uniref:Methyltransferase domain-containing protein n=1 Tax=Colletotrichum gloeosporioides TaxID=474922 RepID=A0A8H4CHI0_COLGL|nr:uncharacterized protein GCG54_00008442 [Colletotrichum gloeosporioides]KAF3803939.1 hypothetical protein GCG54_00008442 [Colletotrichum gloeosporioides]
MGRAEFGNAIYFPLFLQWFYDTLVLRFICPRAWGCPEDVLQGHYSKHVSSLSAVSCPRLLDIGVGTGHFIEHAPLSSDTTVILADINENPLAEARGRIKRTHKDVDVDFGCLVLEEIRVLMSFPACYFFIVSQEKGAVKEKQSRACADC